MMANLDNRLQAASVQLAASPVVQGQSASQHFGTVEHRQEVRSQMTEHAPMKTLTVGRVARQAGCTQIAYPQAGLGGLRQGVEQGTLQRFTR
ncbi:hypothetical protein D3C78_953290 [compost metagenome]